MWDTLHMGVTSLVTVVTPRTGKIIKNVQRVFERGENFLQNSILQLTLNNSNFYGT